MIWNLHLEIWVCKTKQNILATFYLEDLSDFIVENADENLVLADMQKKLGRSANSFDEAI